MARINTTAMRWTVALSLAALVWMFAFAPFAAPSRSLRYRMAPDQLDAFTFELRQEVTTERAGLALVPKFTSHVSGELQRYVARIFRDGSVGMVARVISLDGAIVRGDQRMPLALEGIDGRSLSLRLDRGGEVLDSYGWHHLRRSGSQDLLDDVFLQSLARLPPQLPEQGRAQSITYRLRIPVEAGLDCQQTWVLAFQRSTEPCDGRCTLLDYEGTATETCVDRQRGMERNSDGEISGQLAIAPAGVQRSLRSHRWRLSWERRLGPGPGQGGGAVMVRQWLKTEGLLEAAEASR